MRVFPCLGASRREKHSLGSALLLWVMALFVCGNLAPVYAEDAEETFPELGEIKDLVRMKRPAGVAFHVMDHDTEAYEWVLPRLDKYIEIIRDKWPGLPMAVVSHGDEIFSLTKANEAKYSEFHRRIRDLVQKDRINFQVCGAFAALSGVDESEFADFIEVVPSAPTQISDYRFMGYRVIHLDLTW